MPEQVLLFGGSRVTDVAREEPNATFEEPDAASPPSTERLLGADGFAAETVADPVTVIDRTSNIGSIAALLDRWIIISSSCADTSELLWTCAASWTPRCRSR